jgi:hypothetical protein
MQFTYIRMIIKVTLIPERRSPLSVKMLNVNVANSWEDQIKMDLREIDWKGVDRVHLAQDRDWWWALVNPVMYLHVLGQRS